MVMGIFNRVKQRFQAGAERVRISSEFAVPDEELLPKVQGLFDALYGLQKEYAHLNEGLVLDVPGIGEKFHRANISDLGREKAMAAIPERYARHAKDLNYALAVCKDRNIDISGLKTHGLPVKGITDQEGYDPTDPTLVEFTSFVTGDNSPTNTPEG